MTIEIKNIFNPNRVVQKVELMGNCITNGRNLMYTVAQNLSLTSNEMDSLYILLNRGGIKQGPSSSSLKVLLKLTQIDPRL